jgi:two-component system, cell cycle sensor histidine kinase PleC
VFSYIRIFSIISLLIVVGAAYSVGLYYRHIASDDMLDMVKTNSQRLATAYTQSVWMKHRNTISRLSRLDVQKWKNYREYQDLRKDTVNFFEQMKINEMRLYLKNGAMILSVNPTIGDKVMWIDKNDKEFKSALKGESDAEVHENTEYYLANGEKKEGSVIHTYSPIYTQNYIRILADNPTTYMDAIIRIDYDVTETWKKLSNFQYIAMFGIISIFCLLITLLIFFSRRAETIIAKQHELNLELTAAAATAETENRDKSMFLANISHELRTPLNAIIGFSEILYTTLERTLDPNHVEYLKDIHGSGKHLLSLINDILEFSKAEAGKLEIDLAEIDGIKMVKNSVRLMIPRAEEAQVTLIEDLPKAHFVLHTDAKKLKQVLLNLLSNSVKFTHPNGQVKITAWHDVVRNRAVFVVSDTGIGIAPKDISKVMTPFGQVDSQLSRRYEGTGLGLPLSKKLVEILGGNFKIESEVGKGTTVTIDVPMSLNKEDVRSM